MSNILVTGGAGFIGSFIADKLIENGHFVRIFDNLEPQIHSGKIPDYLNKKAEFVKGDVRDYDDFSKALDNIDIVFHEAALVGIEPSFLDSRKFVEVNSLGTANLLHLIRNERHDVKKVIIPGTVGIYGEGNYLCEKCGERKSEFRASEELESSFWEIKCKKCNMAMKPVSVPEDKPFSVSNVYSLTKLDQEIMCMAVGRKYGIPVSVLRYFNVYGPRQSTINPYSGVITKFIDNILGKKPLTLYEDGNQSRDFVNVHDVIQANMLAMESSRANFEIFNVGTGMPTTIRQVAETLLQLTNSNSGISVTNKYRYGDIRHCTADISKIRRMLGFKPHVELKDGLLELIEWHKNRKA